MIGKNVSHYKILEKLGEGGMGVVYRAQDIKLKRTVALKFLNPQALGSEEERIRFIREAQAAAVLDHPNICTVYEIDEVKGHTFISMACIDGENLRDKIAKGGLKVEQALDIAIQVAKGLQMAHEKGVVHRDIKSGNIMLTSTGQAKITDFGLAKLSGQTTLTKTDTAMGTVAYMSPEQARGEMVDHRTDIWSLGVVLYEMITGSLPFKSDYQQAVIYSILNEDPKQIRELKKEIPENLEGIVNKALKKDPANRYQSITEILDDLQTVKKDIAGDKAPGIKKQSKRKTLPAILISLAVVLVLICAIWFVAHKEEQIPIKIPVGVMFFDNQTGEEKYNYLRKVLADMLITDLSHSRYLRVMTFESMFDLLKSLGHEDVEIIDAAMGFELCKLAGAHVLVLGSITKSGNTFVLNTQVLDVDTKELISPPFRVTGEGEGSILGNLVDDLTDKIKKGLEISIKEIQLEKTDISDLTTTSLEAYQYYLAGREAAFRMYYQEAIENLEKAVVLDSAFVEAYDALARQYYSLGDDVKAIEIIEKVKSFSGKLTEGKLVGILALEAYLKHDWDLAINYYRRLITINPEDISAHLSLGMIYYQKKMMYEEGIFEFERVLELDREGAMHYSSLTPGEKEKTVSFTYNVLGWAYLRKGEIDKAQVSFKKYVNLLPNQTYPLTVLGDFHLIIGNYDQAITNLRKSLSIKPVYPLTPLLLGEAYVAKGMYAQAQQSYEGYLALPLSEVEKWEGHFYLGKLYFLKGDNTKAIEQGLQATALKPEALEAHWLLGLALVKKGDFDQAQSEISIIQELMEKTRTEESKTSYYHILGEFYLGKGFHREALENFNKAADITSLDRAFFLNSCGEAYFETGELNKATEKGEAVLKINPNYAQTHYLLGLIYQKKGKREKAREHFKKFLEIWKEADENLPQFIEAKRQLEKL